MMDPLSSGRLALDDSTFRSMARAHADHPAAGDETSVRSSRPNRRPRQRRGVHARSVMRASNAVRVGISLALMAVLLAVFLWNVDFDRTIEGLTRHRRDSPMVA